MADWTSEYTGMINDCEKRELRLTEWELGFLDSLGMQITDQGRRPSAKQIETLENIWERVTSKG